MSAEPACATSMQLMHSPGERPQLEQRQFLRRITECAVIGNRLRAVSSSPRVAGARLPSPHLFRLRDGAVAVPPLQSPVAALHIERIFTDTAYASDNVWNATCAADCGESLAKSASGSIPARRAVPTSRLTLPPNPTCRAAVAKSQ